MLHGDVGTSSKVMSTQQAVQIKKKKKKMKPFALQDHIRVPGNKQMLQYGIKIAATKLYVHIRFG